MIPIHLVLSEGTKSPKVVSVSPQLVLSGRLSEIQIIRIQPVPIESETLEVGHKICIFLE